MLNSVRKYGNKCEKAEKFAIIPLKALCTLGKSKIQITKQLSYFYINKTHIFHIQDSK